MRSILLTVLTTLLASFSPPQQPKGRIEGIVTGIDGHPLAQARVNLRNLHTDGRVSDPDFATVSGSDGRFILKDLEPGHYRLSAALKGYLDAEYGQKRPNRPGAELDLTASLTQKDLVIRMTPGGTVSGRVYSEDGRPLEGASVQLIRPRYQENGEVISQLLSNARTNDLGEYRMYWITPGTYYMVTTYTDADVRIDPRNRLSSIIDQVEGNDDVVLPTYYPNAVDVSQATPVRVEPGGELRGIDFTMARVASVRLKGQVINGTTGAPEPGAGIDVRRKQEGWANLSAVSSTMTGPNGEFEVRRVPGGFNTVYVNVVPKGPDFRALYAQLDLQVGDKDIGGLRLVVEPSYPITGKVSFEGRLQRGRGPTLQFLGLGNNARGIAGPIDGDQAFSAPVQYTGVFRLTLVNGSGYYIRSARTSSGDVMRDGIDVTGASEPLEIQLAIASGAIEGSVSDDRGRPAVAAQVVLIPFSAPQRFDLYATAVTDQLGRFKLNQLAPGEYKLFAWDDIDPYAYYDPGFLQPYDFRGTAIKVGESGTVSANLKLITN